MTPICLVTGGAGFLGSHVAADLLRQGKEVHVVDDLSGGDHMNVPIGCGWHYGDIVDPAFVDQLFETVKPTHVFHLAAYAAEGLSHFIRRYNYTNNVIGSVNLINAAVRTKVERFVFTSSVAVYGDHGHEPVTEDMRPEPEDPYGIAKLAVELDLRAAGAMFGLGFTIFRPHNVYGPHQNLADPYRNVVGIFMNQCLRGELLTVFGNGEQSRAFSCVSDVAPAIASAPWMKGTQNRTFNIGGEQVTRVKDLARQVGDAMGRPTPMLFLPARHEVQTIAVDHARATRTFGPARTSLRDGLQIMAEWAWRHGGGPPTSHVTPELVDGLPPSWVRRS